MPEMHNALTRGFATRRAAGGPMFVLHAQRGESLPKALLCDAKNAVLKLEDKRVLIRSICAQADGSFVGNIYGFEPSFALEHEGMKVNDHIEFREEHVFSAGD
jgi:hypothetical protein